MLLCGAERGDLFGEDLVDGLAGAFGVVPQPRLVGLWQAQGHRVALVAAH
jgi:hypothetical protein